MEQIMLRLREMKNELDILKDEHQTMNNASDELAASAQFGGQRQFVVATLKKRKLWLKDRITSINKMLLTRRKEGKLIVLNPLRNITAPTFTSWSANATSNFRTEVEYCVNFPGSES
mmetsp:Transcript_81627/g.219340  ORF Transcript_81627/g.219340 Transcript_81627/m.219340 type:complete len:117 (+) Transcript_81627:181-531(+)